MNLTPKEVESYVKICFYVRVEIHLTQENPAWTQEEYRPPRS